MTQGARCPPLRSEIARDLPVEEIRYSQVWEDHLLLESALEVERDDVLLAVASAGCNVLALLLRGPRRIVAVDMSPAQTALLELKLSGIRHLDHRRFACLLGARSGEDPVALYRGIRSSLPGPVRSFWDAREEKIATGVLHCGRLESFFRSFQNELTRHWPAQRIRELLRAESLDRQRELFETAATPSMQSFVRSFFQREHVASRGRDPAQFRYATAEDTGRYLLERLRNACTRVPAAGNFYLEYFLTARYRRLRSGPPYLRPQVFERLRGLVDRVEVVTAELEDVLSQARPGAFGKAALSDIFEYMGEEHSARFLALLCDKLRPGGRVAYWNLLVPRCAPPSLAGRIRRHRELEDALWRRDRSIFYSAFRVEEVLS